MMRVAAPAFGTVLTAEARLLIAGVVLAAWFRFAGFDPKWRRYWKPYAGDRRPALGRPKKRITAAAAACGPPTRRRGPSPPLVDIPPGLRRDGRAIQMEDTTRSPEHRRCRGGSRAGPRSFPSGQSPNRIGS